jgi:hypothetical protein
MATRRYSDNCIYQNILYNPSLRNTSDLEAGTKTISATAKPGTADYSASLTLPRPSDSRLQVLRIASRVSHTVDSLSSGANLRIQVYVDDSSGLDANLQLFDLTLTGSGNSLATVTVDAENKSQVYNLLKDGSAHVFYWFIWKTAAGSGDTVISVVQLWEGVGCSDASADTNKPLLVLSHTGLADMLVRFNNVAGAAGGYLYILPFIPGSSVGISNNPPLVVAQTGTSIQLAVTSGGIILAGHARIIAYNPSGDFLYINAIALSLRSE